MILDCHAKRLSTDTLRLCFCSRSVAASAQAQSPPGADKVFQLNVAHGAHGALILNWVIAPGNYLYRDKIKITSRQGASIRASTPAGDMKRRSISLAKRKSITGQAQATVSAESLGGRSELVVSFQGCAEQGICYPPVTKTIDLKTLSVAEPTARATAPAPQSSSNWSVRSGFGDGQAHRVAKATGTQPDNPRSWRKRCLNAGRLCRVWLAAGLHAVRIPDDTDPVRDARRSRARS